MSSGANRTTRRRSDRDVARRATPLTRIRFRAPPAAAIEPGRTSATSIAFNAKYLADVLEKVAAEQFALELQGPLAPGVFKPIGDEMYVHVVMPVRTTS